MQTRSMTRRAKYHKFFTTAPSDVLDEIFSYLSDKKIILSKNHIKNSYIYEKFLNYVSSMNIKIIGERIYMVYFFRWYKSNSDTVSISYL